MNPDELRYTKQHEWVRVEPDGAATVGITSYAQDQLGDVVFVDLPEIGVAVEQHQPFGSIDSVKTASELFSPLTGEVLQTNDRVADEPELVNADPYGEGWLLKVRPTDTAELDGLLSAEEYAAHTAET